MAVSITAIFDDCISWEIKLENAPKEKARLISEMSWDLSERMVTSWRSANP